MSSPLARNERGFGSAPLPQCLRQKSQHCAAALLRHPFFFISLHRAYFPVSKSLRKIKNGPGMREIDHFLCAEPAPYVVLAKRGKSAFWAQPLTASSIFSLPSHPPCCPLFRSGSTTENEPEMKKIDCFFCFSWKESLPPTASTERESHIFVPEAPPYYGTNFFHFTS